MRPVFYIFPFFSPIAASPAGASPSDLIDPMRVDQLLQRQLAQMQHQAQQMTAGPVAAAQSAHQLPSVSSASNCIQCSLCGTILPSQTYMKHLREFHRVACSLETTGCPLCLGTVPLMVSIEPDTNLLQPWVIKNIFISK